MPRKLTTNDIVGERCSIHHKDGSIWAEGKMLGNLPDGHWQWFRKEGSIMRSGNFKNGILVGKWTTYDRRGKVVKVTNHVQQEP